MDDNDKSRIEEIYFTLVGSLGSKGLVKRMEEMEEAVQTISKKIWLATGGISAIISFWEVIRIMKP